MEGTRPAGPAQTLLAINAWLVFLFLYAPIVVLIVFSFNDNRNVGVWTEPSLRWYQEMLQDENVRGRCATRWWWRWFRRWSPPSSAPRPAWRWSGSGSAGSAPSTGCSTSPSSFRT